VKLIIGDFVCHRHHPHIYGVVIMTAVTLKDAHVCEVLITLNPVHPYTVGTVKYLNQLYWDKVGGEDYLLRKGKEPPDDSQPL
tara:strand:- start:1743 stop:1991 length:249 start_codon:yes stop_codon:yes gene_type:complete